MPRSVLLPDSLNTEFWRTLLDAVDYVWKDNIDAKIQDIFRINEAVRFITTEDHELTPESNKDVLDRETAMKKLNSLGLKLRSTEGISDLALTRLCANISMYWFGKGNQQFIPFLEYTLGVKTKAVQLYTNDYVNFLEAGDPGIGSLIYDGGSWYPTSHINMYVAPNTLIDTDLQSFQDVFFSIVPYTIVVHKWKILNF
jgi:hypothetical protein